MNTARDPIVTCRRDEDGRINIDVEVADDDSPCDESHCDRLADAIRAEIERIVGGPVEIGPFTYSFGGKAAGPPGRIMGPQAIQLEFYKRYGNVPQRNAEDRCPPSKSS
jgi:hypothetical protein